MLEAQFGMAVHPWEALCMNLGHKSKGKILRLMFFYVLADAPLLLRVLLSWSLTSLPHCPQAPETVTITLGRYILPPLHPQLGQAL